MRRALERRVRKYKRRYLAETAAGVDAGQSAAKLKAARQQLSAFLAETEGEAGRRKGGDAGLWAKGSETGGCGGKAFYG